MTNRTVSVPSLGYKSESRRKRDGNTRTSTPEIEIWKKFISNEDHFLDEDGGPTLNFQAPFHFLPSKEPTKTSREQTDSPKRQNLQSTNSTLTKRSKLAIPSKSKSEPSSMVQVVPVPSIQQRMEEVAAKKIDLNSYNHWKGNLFQKLKEHPAVTEKTKNYFIKREEDLSKEEAEDINTNSTEDQIKLNNLLSNLERGIPVNPFLYSAEGNRRRQVRTNVDTSRLPFDALQQEQHRQLQEEAWRISQEHLTNLPPTPNQKGQRKTSVGNTKKSNRNSSKLIHAKRSPSLPDEEGLISSAPVSTPRSRMKKNGSSSSLFTISPPDRKLQKSPARKKPFSTFIKKLESVPSPRRTKLKERSGREIHLPDDSPSRESESFIRQLEAREDEDDLVEDLSTFILSPKRKSAILRPGKPRHWEVNNRSHSMTLTNSPVQGKEISDFVQDSVEDEDSLSLTDTPLDFIESTDIKSDEDDNKDVECNVHLNTPCVL